MQRVLPTLIGQFLTTTLLVSVLPIVSIAWAISDKEPGTGGCSRGAMAMHMPTANAWLTVGVALEFVHEDTALQRPAPDEERHSRPQLAGLLDAFGLTIHF